MRILVSGRMAPRWLDRLRQQFDLDYYDWGDDQRLLDRDELIARLAGRHVLITEADHIDGEILDHARDLVAIIDCRGAPTNIAIEAATERGIVVFNTPGRNADAVADLTVAMMVMAARNAWLGIQNLISNRWVEVGFEKCYLAHMGYELPGKTVGLVGLGAIGRKVAARLRGFEMYILGYDPYVPPDDVADLNIEMVALDELLSRSDFVSLHAPVTPETISMIGGREFGLMKPTAFFINTARAALVDEQAMYKALAKRQIAGAALDVFHEEPLSADAPLLQLPNVFPLPHIGGATYEVIDHQSRIAYETLMRFVEGNPIHVVNLAALDRALARLSFILND